MNDSFDKQADQARRDKEFHEYCRKTSILPPLAGLLFFVIVIAAAAILIGDC